MILVILKIRPKNPDSCFFLDRALKDLSVHGQLHLFLQTHQSQILGGIHRTVAVKVHLLHHLPNVLSLETRMGSDSVSLRKNMIQSLDVLGIQLHYVEIFGYDQRKFRSSNFRLY